MSTAGLALFQNCGSGVGSTLSNIQATQSNPALKSLGMPLQMQMNQISFMSCPNAGLSASTNPDPLNNPFFHFRFGAYNNTLYSTSAVNSSVFTEGSFLYYNGSNIGGLGFSATAVNYLRKNNINPPPTQLQTMLSSSQYSAGSQPAAAIIYPNGARSASMAPTFSSGTGSTGAPVATTLLLPLNNSNLTSELVNAPFVANGGTQMTGYFPNLGSVSAALMGTLNFPLNDMAYLESHFGSMLLFFGFTAAGTATPANIISGLQGPDFLQTSSTTVDPTQRLFGNAYSFNWSVPYLNGPSFFYLEGGPAHLPATATQIHEYDLSQNAGFNGTDLAQSNEIWDCFHLVVVRDTDRKYYTIPSSTTGNNVINIDRSSGAPNCSTGTSTPSCAQFGVGSAIFPGHAQSLLASGVPLQVNYLSGPSEVLAVQSSLTSTYSGYQNIYAGTMMACPNEDPSTLNAMQLDQLKILRRFLSADMWDINLAYGCAVPRPAALTSGGQCYTGSDSDPAKLVQYDLSGGESCGLGSPFHTECAATISMCTRFQ